MVHSTLICGRTLLNIRQAAPTDHRPAVRWRRWDALLSRSSDQSGGVMVAFPGAAGVDDTGIQWQATNCLYAGWQNLVDGAEDHRGDGSQRLVGALAARWRRRARLPPPGRSSTKTLQRFRLRPIARPTRQSPSRPPVRPISRWAAISPLCRRRGTTRRRWLSTVSFGRRWNRSPTPAAPRSAVRERQALSRRPA